MKQFLLALIVCPVVAVAQTPERRWSLEMKSGLTATRELDVQMIWAAASAQATIGKRPTKPWTKDWAMAMLGLPPGIAAARRAQDTGVPEASVRATAYVIGLEPPPWAVPAHRQVGGYVGVGYAMPTSFGGLAFEVGVHTYATTWRPSALPVGGGL
jgi:hypothetical protein